VFERAAHPWHTFLSFFFNRTFYADILFSWLAPHARPRVEVKNKKEINKRKFHTWYRIVIIDTPAAFLPFWPRGLELARRARALQLHPLIDSAQNASPAAARRWIPAAASAWVDGCPCQRRHLEVAVHLLLQ
jgi:hypothetical protein